jgi:hypothetical protein
MNTGYSPDPVDEEMLAYKIASENTVSNMKSQI